MTSRYQHDRQVDSHERSARGSRLAFSLITLALLAGVVAGVAAASRSNKWWWDNLAGPDSSNFVASDQIKKSNVNQLEVAVSTQS
jgi:hypothetical protein